MARIRSVKPSLRTSRVVASWPIPARYAFVLLWGYLDDYGRGIDDIRLLVADLFPLDRDITEKKLEAWIRLFTSSDNPERHAPVCRYTIAGVNYLHCVNWPEHQKPNRPTPSVHPPCPTHDALTAPLTARLTEPSRNDSRQEREGEREKEGEASRPARWCTRHPGGTTTACGACAIARRAHDTWTPSNTTGIHNLHQAIPTHLRSTP